MNEAILTEPENVFFENNIFIGSLRESSEPTEVVYPPFLLWGALASLDSTWDLS